MRSIATREVQTSPSTQFSVTPQCEQTAEEKLKFFNEHLEMQRIRRAVCAEYVKYYVEKPAHNNRLGLPDKIAVYLCSELTEASTADIASYFGRQYSSSVLGIVVEVSGMLRDPLFNEHLCKLRRSIETH